MSRRSPSLAALCAFEATARRLSMTEAGRELGLTRANISLHIRAIERELGTPLFHRQGPNPLVLSERGRAALADLSLGFAAITRGASKLYGNDMSARLTVSVDPSLAIAWLVPHLAGFHDENPGIDLRIETTEDVVALGGGGPAMAIRYGDGNFPGLHAEPLFAEAVFPVCAPALAEGPPGLRVPADLTGHTLLHLDRAAGKLAWPDWRGWLRVAGAVGVDADKGPRFTRHAMTLQAAVDGQGVALGSSPLVADDLAAGRLVRPFESMLHSPFGYYLVATEAGAGEPAPAAFRAWITAEATASAQGRSVMK